MTTLRTERPLGALGTLAALSLFCAFALPAAAEIWQYTVPVALAPGKDGNARTVTAYLWIPPNAERIRGVIIGSLTFLEKDPAIRAAAAQEQLAFVYFDPAFDALFNYGERHAADILQRALDDLAAVSGYREIACAPLLPIGRSTSGIFARNVAYWNPSRTIAVIYMKSGQIGPPTYDPTASLAGVPFVALNGQFEEFGPGPNGVVRPYESNEVQWMVVRDTLVSLRQADDRHLVSMVVDPGAGHYTFSPGLVRYVALYIRKAAQARIPDWPVDATEPVKCREIDPQSGWLTDTAMTANRIAPAPFTKYTGNPRSAFWHFDEELARASEAFHAGKFGKRTQMVTFTVDGKPLTPSPRMSLPFVPVEDGQSLQVSADFVPQIPPNRPYAGEPLSHAAGPVQFRVLRGPVEQTGPDTLRIKAETIGISKEILLIAYHPGDATFRDCEQPATIAVPTPQEGAPQTITFPAIDDRTAHSDPVTLQATCDSGLPVAYYVAAGPAVLEGNRLRITDIPPRAKFPIPVKVVAYQWGRLLEPKYQAARPVEQTFLITGR